MSNEGERHTSVETAISEVLNAEQTALSRIAACEDRASRIVKDARKTVRAMVRRSRERISRLHAGCTQRTRDMVAEMEREAAADTKRPPAANRDKDMRLAAVRSVARDLTERSTPDAR